MSNQFYKGLRMEELYAMAVYCILQVLYLHEPPMSKKKMKRKKYLTQ